MQRSLVDWHGLVYGLLAIVVCLLMAFSQPSLVSAACPCSSNTTQATCAGPQVGCSWTACGACSLVNL